MSTATPRQPFIARLRRSLGAGFYKATAPQLSQVSPQKTGPPTVAGFFSTPSGIGESARLCFQALSDCGLSPGAVDVSTRFGQAPSGPVDGPWRRAGDTGLGPIVIHANPPEFPAILSHIGKRNLTGRLIIGYWVWELPTVPKSWSTTCKYVHEIWTPSLFSAKSLAPIANCPVRIVPHRLAIPHINSQREKPDSDTKAFNVLAMCDLKSSLSRKNPIGAISAFLKAFGDDPGTHLILKVGSVDSQVSAYSTVLKAVEGHENITLHTSVLSKRDIDTMIHEADVILSPHRAEGFGLVLAQAMLAGKPVIATGWSGNTDFMDDESAVLLPYDMVPVRDPQGLYKGGEWAEPDIEVAAAGLRRLRNDRLFRHELGIAAQKEALQFFDKNRWNDTLGETFFKYVSV